MNRRFRSLVDRHERRVYSLAQHLLRDPSEAADVTQEAYLRLWENLEGLTEQRVEPWLLRVTRNLCIDRLRRWRPVSAIDPDLTVANGDGPGDAIARSELSDWLNAAIDRLDEPYRSLIVLRDLQQHSYQEIAGRLSLSLTQVKVYLHRARGKLRTALQDEDDQALL